MDVMPINWLDEVIEWRGCKYRVIFVYWLWLSLLSSLIFVYYIGHISFITWTEKRITHKHVIFESATECKTKRLQQQKMLSVNHYLLPFLLFEWICLFCHAANRISLLNGFWLGVMRFPWNCVDSRTFAFGVYSSEANQNSENFQSFKENNQNNCSKCENCFKAVAR